MLWNPTGETGEDGKAVGGRHYVYVTNNPMMAVKHWAISA